MISKEDVGHIKSSFLGDFNVYYPPAFKHSPLATAEQMLRLYKDNGSGTASSHFMLFTHCGIRLALPPIYPEALEGNESLGVVGLAITTDEVSKYFQKVYEEKGASEILRIFTNGLLFRVGLDTIVGEVIKGTNSKIKYVELKDYLKFLLEWNLWRSLFSPTDYSFTFIGLNNYGKLLHIYKCEPFDCTKLHDSLGIKSILAE